MLLTIHLAILAVYGTLIVCVYLHVIISLLSPFRKYQSYVFLPFQHSQLITTFILYRSDDAMARQTSPVKIMFQILQCLHHLVMLQDDANTAGPRHSQAFFQKAKELDRFVGPAMPTPGLADKIKSINLAWAFAIR